jgi:hypothetical protein
MESLKRRKFQRERMLWYQQIDTLREMMVSHQPHTEEHHKAIDEYASKYDLEFHPYCYTGPLAQACCAGCLGCVKLMIQHKSDVDCAIRELNILRNQFQVFLKFTPNQQECVDYIVHQ